MITQSEKPDLVSLHPSTAPNTITMDMYLKLQQENEALKQEKVKIVVENEALKKENVEVVADNVVLKAKNEDLLENFKKVRQQKNYFFSRSNHYHRISVAQRKGEIPHKTQNLIVRQKLQNKLSQAKLDILLKNQKTSKKFTKKEISDAMDIAGT